MPAIPDIASVADLRFGRDPVLDAWILHFMTENNLEHLLNPLLNASPEQLRFMAVLEDDQVFIPCSDELFGMLIRTDLPNRLQQSYNVCWRVFINLVNEHIRDIYTRRRIIQFARHRFRLALSSHIAIPSRLMKRLASIFLTQSGLVDPYRDLKQLYNRRVQGLIRSPSMDSVLSACPEERMACSRLQDLRLELDLLELRRLLSLSAWSEVWRHGQGMPSGETLHAELSKPCEGFKALHSLFGPDGQAPRKILYLANASGGVLLDLMIIRLLLRRGCQVILALKDGFYFQSPSIQDMEHDPVLAAAMEGAHVIHEENMGKNALLQALRMHRFVVISDGTRERFNLYRTSVTFARAWKECDVVLAKGEPHWRRLIRTGHQFTRDVFCFHRDEAGAFRLHHKPKPAHVRTYTEADLRAMADAIIQEMRQARSAGKSVMFYSAVVGSIPGQTKTAIRILDTYVNYLRSRLEGTYVINPAEHFQPGMDGDDLMFMWERVQRSGLIDVWRFQTDTDIEKAFELMGQKVPPVWTGKDATYSTGCTKEMHIALDMQARQRELQIIGPSPEKFFRRREYGVGKYFDVGIDYQ
jgi:uncharacterized protein with ATP-grasp and redox domains